MRRLALTGSVKGRLTILFESGKYAECICVCGVQKRILRCNIISGRSNSCGCLRDAKTSEANTTHGKSKTAMYAIWKGMHQRCSNPMKSNYQWYGGKDIQVCAAWHSYETFFKDMQAEYKPGLAIDRVDPNRNYEPNNCRWITRSENVSRGHSVAQLC